MFRRARRQDVISFALSGGGARGATQFGALRALTEASIWPALVAGTSAGSVNASWFALHPHRLDRLQDVWMRLRTQDVFPGNRLRLLLNMTRRGYIHDSAVWEAALRRDFGSATFEEAKIPCAIVAVRLSDGQRVVFDSGEIVPAMMASTAIPGVFPPYEIDGEFYVDGGVLEYLPLPTVIERGATVVYALDCSGFPLGHNGDLSVLDRTGLIASQAAVMRCTSLSETRGRVVHVLRPVLPALRDGRDFSQSEQLIAAGYEHARRYLEEHPPTGFGQETGS